MEAFPWDEAPHYLCLSESNSYIQMMKSAKKWRRQNATNGMYCSRRRRILVCTENLSSSVVMVKSANKGV